MILLIPQIPAYKLFRRFGFPKMLPLNLTVSLTNRCNSRCLTCRVYDRPVAEFSPDEYARTFRSLGRRPYWVTMSGGEPFLREDIVEICGSAYDLCRPRIINIATNGLLSEVISERAAEIARRAPKSEIIVNLSLDGVGEEHDAIRRVKNNFERALTTFRKLKEIAAPNLTVGIHTVISRFNVADFPRIAEELMGLNPDSYIAEIAEERVELGTVGGNITPSLEEYSRAVGFLTSRIREQPYRGLAGIAQAFRSRYYLLAERTLREKRQILPCYAGFISAQIAPDGEVWACCVKAESMGNLRRAGYDFSKVWFSEKAESVRAPIRRGECFCPLANAGYTNMLASARTMVPVLKIMARNKLRGRRRKPSPRG